MTIKHIKNFVVDNRAEYYSDKISSSDARAIASGDYHLMEELWCNKIELISVDLSNKLPVQLGIATEKFHTDWLNKKLSKNNIEGYGSDHNEQNTQHHIVIEVENKGYPYTMASTLDVSYGTDNDLDLSIVELKHTNQLTTLDKQIEFYYPQLQHHMYVAGTGEILFSAIFGNQRHEYDIVKRDDDYLYTYMQRVREVGERLYDFWHRPEAFYMDGEPEGIDREQWYKISQEFSWLSGPPIEQKVVTASGIVYNLNKNADYNWAREFIDIAEDTIQSNKLASKHKTSNEENKNKLKGLIPDDAKSVIHNGVTASRDRTGRLSIRIKEQNNG